MHYGITTKLKMSESWPAKNILFFRNEITIIPDSLCVIMCMLKHSFSGNRKIYMCRSAFRNSGHLMYFEEH